MPRKIHRGLVSHSASSKRPATTEPEEAKFLTVAQVSLNRANADLELLPQKFTERHIAQVCEYSENHFGNPLPRIFRGLVASSHRLNFIGNALRDF